MRHDVIPDVMFVLNNTENMGKRTCRIPASKLIKEMLTVIHKAGYIGSFNFIDNGKTGEFEVELVGRINRSRAIKPRFPAKYTEYEKWEKRYLPSRDFGILIVSTPKGIMTQKEAKEKELGGRMLAYIY